MARVVDGGGGAGYGVWSWQAAAADLWIGSGGGVGVFEVEAGGGALKQNSLFCGLDRPETMLGRHVLSPGSGKSNRQPLRDILRISTAGRYATMFLLSYSDRE